MTGSDYYIEIVFAFHQNYPEFNDENNVKDLYEVLKDVPNFKSKLLQMENMTDFISVGCNLNMLMSLEQAESESVSSNLEICDEDVQAMKAECDEHYDIMEYCRDKDDFMTEYIAERHLTEESVGKVASASPE